MRSWLSAHSSTLHQGRVDTGGPAARNPTHPHRKPATQPRAPKAARPEHVAQSMWLAVPLQFAQSQSLLHSHR